MQGYTTPKTPGQALIQGARLGNRDRFATGWDAERIEIDRFFIAAREMRDRATRLGRPEEAAAWLTLWQQLSQVIETMDLIAGTLGGPDTEF